jgi:hypothetical protein
VELGIFDQSDNLEMTLLFTPPPDLKAAALNLDRGHWIIEVMIQINSLAIGNEAISPV